MTNAVRRVALAEIPAVPLALVVFPLLMAARTAVTALWSTPAGPSALRHPVVFDAIYWGATLLCVYWAVISRKHLKRTVYIGMTVGMISMHRAVTVAEARFVFGNVAWSAVVNWATFSLGALVTMTMSMQYIQETAGHDHDDGG